MVKGRLLFLIKYFLFWTGYFLLCKILFVAYHYKSFLSLDPLLISGLFLHGLRLDLSMASYLSILPFLLFSLGSLNRYGPQTGRFIRFYTVFLIGIISFFTMLDLELFTYWGFRLDSTFIKYLKTPAEAIASTLSSPLLLLSVLLIALIILSIIIFRKFIYENFSSERSGLKSFFGGLILTALLIVPLRGGFQLAPINESTVFFSNNLLVNNAALNMPWNFVHSILEKSYDKKNPYSFFSAEESERRIQDLFKSESKNTSVLRIRKPNIILIIWESFTSKALIKYDGKEVTPEFKKLVSEGIYFDNIYSSGDRSDKGLASILSAFPALPTASVINNPVKGAKLNSLPLVLKERGYSTSFIYGGELEFANIKSYLINQKLDQLIGKNEFEDSQLNSKWGAHDEHTMNRLMEVINKSKKPFFSTLFTLSSHEPFEIPASPLFQNTSRDHQFLNAHHYTDKCLGDFIRKAKQQSWWDSSLVIIIADHGHPLPGPGAATHVPEEFKIPMLWLGGALNKNQRVKKLGSQVDLAATLLHQLGQLDSSFIFSKNLLDPSTSPFAYYSFNNGFGFISENGFILYDNISNQVLRQEGSASTRELDQGKVMLQKSYEDYLSK